MEHKKNILFIVDVPNWAHDFKTKNLASYLQTDFNINHVYSDTVTESDLNNSDTILIYYCMHLNRMPHLRECFVRNKHKLLIGICSHAEIDNPEVIDIIKSLAVGVFVVNNFMYQKARTTFDLPVFYTPNGVNADFYKTRSTKPVNDKLRIGWAGSLKNHGDHHRGYSNVIVPAISGLDSIEFITANREEKWRTPEEMKEFYYSLDLYICSSINEGTPNTTFEAAACGVPVLTTKVGNMPELIIDGFNGMFFDGSPTDLKIKIEHLKNNHPILYALSENMNTEILHWDWSVKSQTYLKMLKQLFR